MKTQTLIALKFLMVMTILTGVLYPLLMTGLAQLMFPFKANGSMITSEGKVIGSELIGQKFDSTINFWSRPSATDYNAVPSGGSNYGPTSDTLKKLVVARREFFAKMNSVADISSIPEEMIFASGSGIDPHISAEAVLLQVERICKARRFDANQKQKLLLSIRDLTEKPQFSFLGEKRINVLKLNLGLIKIDESKLDNMKNYNQ